ncbi:MAG TPA: four helix bundle protein [Tepidisphaeraceae bacterium]
MEERERGTKARRHEGTKGKKGHTSMSNIRTHRDLIAWQLGMRLAKEIYRVTRGMPKQELFGLTSQMRRAAISIPSNIAEGYGRGTTKDYLKHLRISRGSISELSTQYELAITLEMLSTNKQLWDLLEEADRVLQGLIRSIQPRKYKTM